LKNKKDNVYIVVLNYNNATDTIDCIDSLKNITYSNYNILVVDNNSTDDSLDKIKAKHEDIDYLELSNNFGYAGGNNRGIIYAKDKGANFVLIINNDVIVETDFLTILYDKIEEFSKVVAVAPQIKKYPQTDNIWYYKGKINWVRGMGYNIDYTVLNNNNNQCKKTNFISGCCFLIDLNLIEKNNLDLLSEEYFLYFEDNDFSVKMKNAGMELLFCPTSVVYHKVSGSIGEKSPILNYYYTRNRLLFMKKNHPNKLLYIIFLGFFSMTRMIRTGQWLFTGQFEKIKYMLKGLFDFIREKNGPLS